MSVDPVAVLLSRALRELVRYVDRRDDTFTEDDDVRALEDVAAILSEVAPEDVDRLTALVGSEVAIAVGLSDG